MARSILSFGMFSARAAIIAARSREFHCWIGHAELGGDSDFAGKLAEQLRFRRILPPLAVHDVLEL